MYSLLNTCVSYHIEEGYIFQSPIWLLHKYLLTVSQFPDNNNIYLMSYPIACIACIPNAQSTQHCMLCVTVTVSLKHIFHLVPMQIEFIAYTFSYYWMAVMCFPHVNAVKWYDSCSFANLSIHLTTTGKEYSLPMWWPPCLNLTFCNVWADPNWMVGILQKNTFKMLNSNNFSMLNFGGKSNDL